MLYPFNVLMRLNDALDESTGVTLDEAVSKTLAHAVTPEDEM